MRLNWARVLQVVRVACLCLVVLSSGVSPVSTSAHSGDLAPASGAPRSQAWPPDGPVEGPHPFLTVLCKFADVPDEPDPPAFFERLLGAEYPGLDDYWQEVSYGHISLAGSKVAGWITLPDELAAYFDGEGNANFLKLAQDCGRLGGAGGERGDYFGLNLVFNAGTGVPHGGRICLDDSTHCYGAMWTWPPYLENQAIWAHEMGHALGLHHTGRSAGRAYGNIWDIMSEDGACQSDPELGLLAQHPIAFHKDQLGWIPPGAKLVLRGEGEYTFKLAPLAIRATANNSYLLAEIPIYGLPEHYYTVEARLRSGHDRHLLDDAVVIHEIDLRAEPAAESEVTVRWQGSDRSDAGGNLFSDPLHGISVAVTEQAEDGFTVTVRIDSSRGGGRDELGGRQAPADGLRHPLPAPSSTRLYRPTLSTLDLSSR